MQSTGFQKILSLFGIAMVALYLFLGCLFAFSKMNMLGQPFWVQKTLGSAFIIYAAYRAYRIYKNFKDLNAQDENEN